MQNLRFAQLGLLLVSLGLGNSTFAAAPVNSEPTPQFSDLTAYRGQVVLLDFWASWCGPCRRSFPWMNRLLRTYADDAFAIVAVNLDQKRSNAEAFLREVPAEFEVWFDPAGELAKRYNVSAMPTSVLIDRSGRVILVHHGFLTKQIGRYEQAIREAVANTDAT